MHALWPIAVEHGKIVGLNMTGAKISYGGDVSRQSFALLATAKGSCQEIFLPCLEKPFLLEVSVKKINLMYTKKPQTANEGKLKGFLFR